MMLPTLSSASFTSVSTSARSRAILVRMLSFTYRRKSVATWSLRERAVCMRLPITPMRLTSSCSMKVWISSAPSMASAPLSMSCKISCRVSQIFSASSLGRIFVSPSILTCAMLAKMSCQYSFLSKESDWLKISAFLALGWVKRPSHNFMAVLSRDFLCISIDLSSQKNYNNKRASLLSRGAKPPARHILL